MATSVPASATGLVRWRVRLGAGASMTVGLAAGDRLAGEASHNGNAVVESDEAAARDGF